MGLVVEKEKRLVALLIDPRNIYRAAQSKPVLITVGIRFCATVEKVVGVKLAVAQVLVRIPVQRTASRLCHHINDVPGAPAILRGKGMLLHLEFLHIVRRGHVNNPAPAADGIPSAIQQECGGSEVTATEVEERDVLVGCTLCAAGFNELPLGIVDRRVQFYEVEHIAQIQGQFRHLLCGNFLSDIGIVGLEQGGRLGHHYLVTRADG